MKISFCFIQSYRISFTKEVSPPAEKARVVLDFQKLFLHLFSLSSSCLVVQIATPFLSSASEAADLAVLEDSFVFEFAKTLGEVQEVQKLPETEEFYHADSSPFLLSHFFSRWLFTGSGLFLSRNNEHVLCLPLPQVRVVSPFIQVKNKEANFFWISHYLRLATSSLLLSKEKVNFSFSLPKKEVWIPLGEFPDLEGKESPLKVQQRLLELVGESPPLTLEAWRALREWETLLLEFQKRDWFALSRKVDWIQQKQILEHSLWETSALQGVEKVKPLLEKLLPYGEEVMFSPHCLLRLAGREFFQQVDRERRKLSLSWQELGELFEAYGEFNKLKRSYYLLSPPSQSSCLWDLVWLEENDTLEEEPVWRCLSLRKKVCHVAR